MRAIATSGRHGRGGRGAGGHGQDHGRRRAGSGLSAGGVPGGRGGADRPGGTRAVKPRRHAGEHAASTGRGPAPQRGVRIGSGGAADRRGGDGADQGQRRRTRRRSFATGSRWWRSATRVSSQASRPAAGWARCRSGWARTSSGGGPATRSAERAALAELHGGEPDRWLGLKQRAGELVVHARRPAGGPGGGHGRLAGRRGRGGNRAGDHDRARQPDPRRAQRRGARMARAQGELGERIEVGGLEVAVGDRVIARRNDRELDVDNGTRGTVRAVDLDTHGGDHRDRRRRRPRAAGATTSPSTSSTPTRSPGTAARAQPWSARWSSAARGLHQRMGLHRPVARPRPRPRPPHRRTRRPIRPQRDRAQPARTDRRGSDRRDARGDAAPRARGARHRPGRAARRVRPVPGEAAAEANERAQRQQLALDLDRARR